jgi:hypothetical protein
VPPDAPLVEIEAPIHTSTNLVSTLSLPTTAAPEANLIKQLSPVDTLTSSWLLIVVIAGILLTLLILGLVVLLLVKR